ncbi:MAG: DUF5011 domain-containing protein [Bacilli bacterium]|nr:DUF5011 domain-containing protein [Bacilli bacterium]
MNNIKESLIEYYNSNKISVYVVVGIIILTIVLGISLSAVKNNKKSDNTNPTSSETTQHGKVYLVGSSEVTINQGDAYVEAGYYVVDTNGKVINNLETVTIDPEEIDTSVPGTYYINYSFDNQKVQRIVNVVANNENNSEPIEDDNNNTVELELLGEDTIVLKLNDKYIEPGYIAKDSQEVDLTDTVKVSGDVDTSKLGTYTITYEINDSYNNVITKTRTVIISDVDINVNIKTNLTGNYTNQNVIVTITVTGDDFAYVKFPNNTTSQNKTSTYTISDNGHYKFLIYDKNSKYTIKELDISQIDKKSPTGTCILLINKGSSTFLIQSDDELSGIDKYEMYGDNTLVASTKSASFTSNKTYKSAYVNLYDKAGNMLKLSCNIKENQEVSVKSISIDGSKSLTMTVGETKKVKYNILPSNATNKNVTFKSSNSNIASISTDGTISAKKAGSAVITLTTSNGKKTATVTVTVKAQSTPPTDEEGNSKYNYLEMHFIVSGHNDDAILIRTAKATIMIDGGRYTTKTRVLSYLQTLGVKTIDALIGSHPHYNHIQAQAYIIDNFNVKRTYYPVDINTCVSKKYCDSNDVKYIKDTINKKGIPMTVTKAGSKYEIGDMTLYFIGPYTLDNKSKYKQNANSSIFILKYKNNTFMFTGDTSGTPFTVSKLKPKADALGISLKVDMLKYPHHGNASIDKTLASTLKPKYVIIPNYNYGSKLNSTGKSNLQSVGATIYQQATGGNIVLKSDGNNITVKTKQSASSYKR